MLIESKTLPPEKSSNCPNCDKLTNKVYVSAEFQNYSEFRPRNSIFDKTHRMHILKADQHLIEREIKRLDDELKVETVVTEYKHNEKTGSVKFGKTESTAQKIDSAKVTILKSTAADKFAGDTQSYQAVRVATSKQSHNKFSALMNNKKSLSLKTTNFPRLNSKKSDFTNEVQNIFKHSHFAKKSTNLDRILRTGFEVKTRKLK